MIPAAVQDGRAADDGWQAALAAYAELDPDRLYGNAFLDTLMSQPAGAAAPAGTPAGAQTALRPPSTVSTEPVR